MNKLQRVQKAIKIARERYALPSDDCIEIDDKPVTSVNDEGGVWVQAWLWIAPVDIDGE